MILSTNNNLIIVTWNTQGLNNKYHELELFLKQHDVDIALLTETKLAPHINFFMSGYKILRADHPSGTRQGGSAVFVKRSISHTEMLPICEEEVQVARIGIKINGVDYIVGAFYSAPDRADRRLLMSTIWAVIHEMRQKFIMGGDYNAKHPRWSSATTNPRGRMLFDAVHQLGMEVIHPIEPTHYPSNPNHAPDILDIFLAKGIDSTTTSVHVIHSLSSDHYPVMLNLNGTITCNYLDKLIRHPFDWKLYSETLAHQTNLSISLKTPMDIDKAVSKLTQNIHFASNLGSAHHHFTHRSTFYTPPHIRQLLAVKHNARSLYERTKYPPHKSAYNRATLDLKRALAELKAQGKRNELLLLDRRDGSLWHKAKSLMKQASTIPPLKHNNIWHSTSEEKAFLFSNQLTEQFTPNPSELPNFHRHVEEVITEPLELTPFKDFFTPGQVKNAILRSPTKKSPGPDHITQPLLKNLPRKTLVLLTNIYNAILRTTYFPARWKHAVVIMILKPNKPANDPTSYRPISLLSIFSKIFERLMLPKLLTSLTPIIPDFQFGFRHLHSCQQQLHRVVEDILETFENQQVCRGVFLDTQQAFDRVWHSGLLFKLKPLLSDTHYRVVQSFLSNRTFHVKCGGTQSPSKPVLASVPQGSVWGPILYVVYVSDIPTAQNTVSAMFADDHAVLSRGSSGLTASANLQRHLNDIARWAKQWRIKMSNSKSCATTFTLKTNYNTDPLRMNDIQVPEVEVVRYLGIHLQQRLTYDSHISELVRRLRTRINLLRPLLSQASALSLDNKRLLYLTLVRPIWQYGCSVWGQASNTQIKRVQTQQNRVLRMITNAPWFVRNDVIHRDLDVPKVEDVIKESMSRMNNVITSHHSPALDELRSTWDRTRLPRRLKRKRATDLAD